MKINYRASMVRKLSFIIATGLMWVLFENFTPSVGPSPSNTQQLDQVITPSLLPAPSAILGAGDSWTVSNALWNPLSGFFGNLVQQQTSPYGIGPAVTDAAPLPEAPVDIYTRVSWHSLEPTEGQYNFSIIDNAIQPCPAPAGQKLCLPVGSEFGFRIMALNPMTKLDTNVTTGSDGYPIYSNSPSYMLKDSHGKSHGWLLPVNPTDVTQGHYFIPDWNDSFFIDRAWSLLKALGQKYNSDPRISFLDVGLYGSWGEWHTAGLPDSKDYPSGIPYASSSKYYSINQQAYLANNGVAGAYATGTEASKNAILWAHVRSFPNKQLTMLTDDEPTLCTAMKIHVGNLPIGMRRDSFGSYSGWGSFPYPGKCLDQQGQDLIVNRWKTAPLIVEPFGNGSSPEFPCQTFETDPKTGVLALLEQVSDFHISAIKNAAYCTGGWSALSEDQQQAILQAGLSAGSRLSPNKIWIYFQPGSPSQIVDFHTSWSNLGLTPTYHAWNVEFSIWTTASSTQDAVKLASLPSAVDIRKVVPEASHTFVFDEQFTLPSGLAAGPYELRIRATDPNLYLNPLQLALPNPGSDGYYDLGIINVPN